MAEREAKPKQFFPEGQKIKKPKPVTSRELKAILIAVTLEHTKGECAIAINRKELHEAWGQLALEVAEIKARGHIVEIPFDPFD